MLIGLRLWYLLLPSPRKVPLAPHKAEDPSEGAKDRNRSWVGHAPVDTRDREGNITALIPCHNEQECLPHAIRSLLLQTRPPDRIVVVADNCTDATVEVGRTFGVEVWETVANRHKKAGALNQALDRLLPSLSEEDAVLIMDGDSFLDTGFVEHAAKKLASGRYGGVGGTFRGRPGGGFVGMLQRNEYTRYARDVRRQKGKVLVLTGTATLFGVEALSKVAASRASDQVYDVEVLTEDFELTLALRHLGYEVVSPKECTLTTEVMETWRDLARQRLRWKRGAVENLIQYGWTRVTAEHWLRQGVTILGIFVMATYLATIAYSLAMVHSITLYPLWVGVTSVFAVERAVTVRRRGWRQSLLAALLIFEVPFDLCLQAVHLKAYWQAIRGSERRW